VPIIEPGREDLKDLKGIHLWHGGMSNCSQRVRIALAEFGLDFESHLMNLQAGEHATEEFQRINPNGLVPVLVHDGKVVIDSADIIDYLDTTFGGKKLRPPHLDGAIADLLAQVDKAQLALKYLSFEFFFKHAPRASEDVFERIIHGLDSARLRGFWREYRDGFSRERIHEMAGRAHEHFLRLEALLSDGREWMAGDRFSLADIAWTPNLRRYDLLRWPLDIYPNLRRWFQSACARPSYAKALDGWEPRRMMDQVRPILDDRIVKGDGINRYGPLAALERGGK